MSKDTPIDDPELVKRLRDSSTCRTAFGEVIARYSEPLYWQIRRMVEDHDDANDLLQNTFMKAWSSIENFRGEAKLSTWLYKIATNEVLRFIEKHKQTMVALDDLERQYAYEVQDSGSDDDTAEQLVWLQKAIRHLPEKQRLVFNLRYYDELEYAEISEILNTQVETLKTNIHYAKENIKKYIQKNYYERL